MIGWQRKTLGAAMAIGTAVVLAATAVPAEARDGHRNDRGRHERVYRDHGRAERVYRDHGRAERVYRGRDRAERVYRDHARAERFYRHDGRRWVAPPLLAQPRRLPRARSFTVPRYIRGEHRRAYAPYYAGRVFYEPYGVDLDLYYFPVWVGGRYVYEPYYYYGPELLFSIGGGGPHFFFHIGF